MSTAIRRSISPADPVQARIFEPVSKSNGITLIENGVIYLFDDWEGTNILTGSNCFVVPYKKSLSNVFTGFEVIGWEGLGSSQRINALVNGMHWVKNRDAAVSNQISDLLNGDGKYWNSNDGAARVYDAAISTIIKNRIQFNSGDATTLNNSIISWNFYYPLVKVWHPNGQSSRKVPTPLGVVDSIESNVNSGLTGDQLIIELYNMLTGNGCLLFIGTAANRLLDISGGKTIDFILAKTMTSIAGGITYHSQFNNGTDPADYYINIDNTHTEQNLSTIWNDTEPTNLLISLGTNSNPNGSGVLSMIYYFSSVSGLQNFGGYAGNSGNNNQATGCKNGMFFTKLRAGGTGNWFVVDSFRGDSKPLYWNLTSIEGSVLTVAFDSTSGININTSNGDVNASGDDYIYGHFGEELIPQGNFDIYPTNAVTSSGSNNKTKITFEYKGSANLNSEILLYSSRKAATIEWVLGNMQKTADLSDGYEQIEAEIDVSGVTNDNEMRWRLASNESPLTEHNFKNLKMIWYS